MLRIHYLNITAQTGSGYYMCLSIHLWLHTTGPAVGCELNSRSCKSILGMYQNLFLHFSMVVDSDQH